MVRIWKTRRLGMARTTVGSIQKAARIDISLALAICLMIFASNTTQPAWSQAVIYQDDFEKALKESAETGKPIFALGTRDTCTNCQALLQRIRDDAQVQKLLSGFVLLQMNVDNEAHLAWRTMVPFEGNTLPIVYAVRADRQPIFAKSTMLPDSEFPARLMEWLSESGTALQSRDIELLDAATQSAQKALESGDVNELVRQTRKARKFLFDHAPCYARAALDFQNVFKPSVEEGKQAIESILELTEGTTSIETIAARAMTYAQAEYKLEQLGLMEKEFKAAEKKTNGVREIRTALADARKLVTVSLSKQLSESQRKSLQEVATRQTGNVIGTKASELIGTRD